MTTNTDRIEKQILLKAPIERVWRALTDTAEFGSWFCVGLRGQFVPGQSISGPVLHPGYEHLTWTATIERMEPYRQFAWRWHPYAIDSNKDYSHEPSTLVLFELSEVPGGPMGQPGGTLLKVTESGFDGIPLERRENAYRGNSEGWSIQMGNIERHVSKPT
jgi:uncharacterized protein YndB with AHSA1/START domain